MLLTEQNRGLRAEGFRSVDTDPGVGGHQCIGCKGRIRRLLHRAVALLAAPLPRVKVDHPDALLEFTATDITYSLKTPSYRFAPLIWPWR